MRIFAIFAHASLWLASTAMTIGVAAAAEFPARPINILLSSGASSSVDAMARTLAAVAEKDLGQSIVVTNRPGGDGAIAMSALLGAPADGYTLWGATKTYPVSMNTNLKDRFKADDFQPLVRVQVDPFALVVRGDAPWSNLQEFLEAGKKDLLNVGGFGSATPHGLFNFKLAKASGAKLMWIPFKAGSEAVTALMGSHVDAVLSNPSTITAQLDAGLIRVLAIASEERSPALPDVPTFKEQGIDLVDTQWRGFFVRKGTPEPVIRRLDAALAKAIESPEFKTYLTQTVQEDGYMGPEEFSTFVDQELEEMAGMADEFVKSFQ